VCRPWRRVALSSFTAGSPSASTGFHEPPPENVIQEDVIVISSDEEEEEEDDEEVQEVEMEEEVEVEEVEEEVEVEEEEEEEEGGAILSIRVVMLYPLCVAVEAFLPTVYGQRYLYGQYALCVPSTIVIAIGRLVPSFRVQASTKDADP
jgi:hypothetical protein